jgi:Fibronectin type III domain
MQPLVTVSSMRKRRILAHLTSTALVLTVWSVAIAPSALASDVDVAPLYQTQIHASGGDAVYSANGTLYLSRPYELKLDIYVTPNVNGATATHSLTLPSGDVNYPAKPYGIDLSADGRYLAVADGDWYKARIYDVGDPAAVTEVKSVQLNGKPRGVAFGPGNQLFVTDFDSGRLLVFGNALGAGGLVPSASIGGMQRAYGVALDSSDNVYVSFNEGNNPFFPTVAVFGASQISTCPVAPDSCSLTPQRQIRGDNTGLSNPYSIDVDSSDRLYVADSGSDSISIFADGATGNIAPLQRIRGERTEIHAPSGMAISPTGMITTQNSNSLHLRWMTFAAPIFPPSAPTAVTGTAGNGRVEVSWTMPSSDGGSAITGYTATAAPGGQMCTATAPTTRCDVTGLTNGTAYTFTVRATNSQGNGPASVASGSLIPTAPSEPPTPASTPSATPNTTTESPNTTTESSIVVTTKPVVAGTADPIEVQMNFVLGLTPTQVRGLSGATLRALPPQAFAVMSASQVRALNPDQVRGNLSRAQLRAIPPKSLREMKPETLRSFAVWQVRSLTRAQARDLREEQVAALGSTKRAIITLKMQEAATSKN